MTQREIARDLSRTLQHRIGELVERHAGVAQAVLGTGEIGVMLMEASVALSLTTAATVAASVAQPGEEAEAFDKTLHAISALAAADRERSLAAVTARLSGAAV